LRRIALLGIAALAILIAALALPPLLPGRWGEPRRLTNLNAISKLPRISGNGEVIAFQSDAGGEDDIYLINWDGTGLRRIPHPNADDWAPAINWDGSRIVFESRPLGSGGAGQLFAFDPGSGSVRQLTNNPWPCSQASMSYDGERIAFMGEVAELRHELFSILWDGSGQRRYELPSVRNAMPSLSGDGSRIAYRGKDRSGAPDIFVVDWDGSGFRRLTSGPAIDVNPSISADGSLVAFSSVMDGPWEIYLARADGSGIKRLTRLNASSLHPALSGDGSRVAFESNAAGDWDIWVANSDGSGLTRITGAGTEDLEPSLSHDGRRLVYRARSGLKSEIWAVSYEGPLRWLGLFSPSIQPSPRADPPRAESLRGIAIRPGAGRGPLQGPTPAPDRAWGRA